MPQGLKVTVDCCFREFSLLVPVFAVFASSGFGDVTDRDIREIREQHFQAVQVPGFSIAVREKPGGKLPKGEVRLELFQMMAAEIQFLLELLLNELRLPAIGRSSGLVVPDTIDPHVGPVDVAALVE